MTQKEEVKIIYIEGILLKNKYSIIDTIEKESEEISDEHEEIFF